MPAFAPFFKKAYWILAGLGAFYGLFLGSLTLPWVQRNALYMHKVNTMWLQDVNEPEAFGFAPQQVVPFHLVTSEESWLYCWHVLPVQSYADDEYSVLFSLREKNLKESLKNSYNFDLLQKDKEARVVINFHGNAGHVGQGHRPQIYRTLTAANPHIHILTFDYRGYGHSPGTPSEIGLIHDAVSFVQFVLKLGIPPDRIALVGQSLGTAVASAVALHFADREASINLLPPAIHNPENVDALEALSSTPNGIDFSGVVLLASFPDVPTLLTTYRIGGVIPVLSPIRFYPRIQAFLKTTIVEEWQTQARLGALTTSLKSADTTQTTAETDDGAETAKPRRLNLFILHARDDADIPWRNGQMVFEAAVSPLKPGFKLPDTDPSDDNLPRPNTRWTRIETPDKNVKVTWQLLSRGGHNAMVESTPATVAVLRAFGLAQERQPGG